MALYQNIMLRKQEAQQTSFELTKLTEDTIDPKEWGKNFPRQYDSYLRTVDIAAHHATAAARPFRSSTTIRVLRTLFAGYAFSVDYREERGHAYMLRDQDETERVQAGQAAGRVPALPRLGHAGLSRRRASRPACPTTRLIGRRRS